MSSKSDGSPACHAFWIGPRLGPIHVACLRSMVAVGHPTFLHVYEEPEDTPDCVTLVDASNLIPKANIFRHKTGSYAMFSDLFRYAILRAGLGIYVDCDVYCLRPIEDADYIFAWEDARYINGAVLKLPAQSPLLNDLWTAINTAGFIPPWERINKRIKWRMKRLVGRYDITQLPLPNFGPRALTYYARARRLSHLALPPETFYPVHYREVAEALLAPRTPISAVISPETVAIHLYNKKLPKEQSHIPSDSILGQIIQVHMTAERAAV